jgi:hypothetical protein
MTFNQSKEEVTSLADASIHVTLYDTFWLTTVSGITISPEYPTALITVAVNVRRRVGI